MFPSPYGEAYFKREAAIELPRGFQSGFHPLTGKRTSRELLIGGIPRKDFSPQIDATPE
jgi:hypothetical protein